MLSTFFYGGKTWEIARAVVGIVVDGVLPDRSQMEFLWEVKYVNLYFFIAFELMYLQCPMKPQSRFIGNFSEFQIESW